ASARRPRLLGQALQTAQTATARAGETATALPERIRTDAAERDAQQNAILCRDNVDLFDVIAGTDDPLVEAETQREVREISRGRHDHRLTRALESEGDWGFFRYPAAGRHFDVMATAPDPPPRVVKDGGRRFRDGYAHRRLPRHPSAARPITNPAPRPT